MNQNSQARYSCFGSGNDFMTQVIEVDTLLWVPYYEFYLLDLGYVFLALSFCFIVSQDYMAYGSQGFLT